jgi:pimeloyl-ACP methyl ester carboxylesterase
MKAEPVERYFGEGPSRLCYFEWGDPSDPTILLLHATGFHARCWDRVIEALPDGYRIIAVDHLGHGRSAKPDSLFDWTRPAHALAVLIEGLSLHFRIAAGHSMGGHCLVQLASRMPERFERLVLIDPVLFPPDMYCDAPDPTTLDASLHPVARRRAIWDSPEQMAARLAEHPSYAIWRPEVLMDYCRYGLLPREEGGFELACLPELEASMYMGSTATDPYPFVDKVKAPVTILRAPTGERTGAIDFTLSPTWEGLAERFAEAEDVYIPDLTHFMPMQDPERIALYISGTLPEA